MKKLVILLASIAFLMASCIRDKNSTVIPDYENSYLPFYKSNFWKYRVAPVGGSVYLQTLAYLSDSVVGTVTWKVCSLTSDSINYTRKYFKKDGNSVIWQLKTDSVNEPTPVALVSDKPQKGQQWESTYLFGTDTLKTTTVVDSTGALREINGRNFPYTVICRQLSYKKQSGNWVLTNVTKFYFTQNIGLIWKKDGSNETTITEWTVF